MNAIVTHRAIVKNIINCSTFKHSSPAGFKLGLTDDFQKLVVTEMRLKHNHATSKVVLFVTIAVYAFDCYYVHEENF